MTPQPQGPDLSPTAPPGTKKKRPWQRRMRSLPGDSHVGPENGRIDVSRTSTITGPSTRQRWWKIRLFRGMLNDIKRRAPYYWSDWRDAWDYRVVPSTVYMYFAKYGIRNNSISLSLSLRAVQSGNCPPVWAMKPFPLSSLLLISSYSREPLM